MLDLKWVELSVPLLEHERGQVWVLKRVQLSVQGMEDKSELLTDNRLEQRMERLKVPLLERWKEQMRVTRLDEMRVPRLESQY